MGLRFTTRGSDSPWVDSVWTCTSDDAEALVGRLVRAGIRQLREGAGGAIGLDLDQRLTS